MPKHPNPDRVTEVFPDPANDRRQRRRFSKEEKQPRAQGEEGPESKRPGRKAARDAKDKQIHSLERKTEKLERELSFGREFGRLWSG